MIRAAQQGARGAAELPQQPGFGTAGVRRMAAEPLVMVARDQQSLVRRGPAIIRATNFKPSRRRLSA